MAKELRLHNSLTKDTEVLKVRDSGVARIYNCGPTVYKRPHLGNMRRFLFSDFLRRSLEFLDYKVVEVTNITDVGHLTQDDIDEGEDKLEVEAKEKNLKPSDIAEDVTAQYFADLKALNIQTPHESPKATDHIGEMHEIIARLLERGHAYQTDSGVYFDVQSFEGYGKLSGNTLDKLEAGARVDVRDDKKHPADFALWKSNDPGHLQQWDSPWGRGYPGWHIECSAMSRKYLGGNIDIHTGGEDNKFPHHENEIAQSEGAFDELFVNLWMHNGFLKLDGGKLAKREGKQLTLESLVEMGYSPMDFRLLVFASHYRTPVDFSEAALVGAHENLVSIKQLLRRLAEISPPSKGDADSELLAEFGGALAEDLNTPKALAILLSYIKETNVRLDAGDLNEQEVKEVWSNLLAADHVLGVIELLLSEVDEEEAPEDVQKLAEHREEARQSKDFELADSLRSQIEKAGWTLEDTDRGPRLIQKK